MTRHLIANPLGVLSAVALVTSLWAGLPSAALPVALAPTASVDDTDDAPAKKDETAQLMFVQTSDGVRIDTDASTLRLVNVNPQTLFFADRSERLGGHLKMDAYLSYWTTGENDFDKNPPNATLSVYEEGSDNNSLVVLEIKKPVVDGKDLTYHYKVIEGAMPEGNGASALFIDWVAMHRGIGGETVAAGRVGGVGAVGVGHIGYGYPRVGVGVRGPVRVYRR